MGTLPVHPFFVGLSSVLHLPQSQRLGTKQSIALFSLVSFSYCLSLGFSHAFTSLGLSFSLFPSPNQLEMLSMRFICPFSGWRASRLLLSFNVKSACCEQLNAGFCVNKCFQYYCVNRVCFVLWEYQTVFPS